MPIMRVAQVAPLCEAVPPLLYGGTERVVAYLSDALSDLGHDVTLFASGESHSRTRLVVGRSQALRLDPQPLKSDVAAHLAMLHDVRQKIDDFDVVHFHIDLLQFPVFARHAQRTLTTLHGRLDIADLQRVYSQWPAFSLVSISDAQRRPLPHAHWVGTVHHGLPANLLCPGPGGDYLAFVGRVSPEKRVDRAIRLAERARMHLRIAAKIDPVDQAYFHDCIEALARSPWVDVIGEVDDSRKNDLLGGAAALLFPIDWPEPFGLVMIEAMACGTPVIAWDCGSVREVVDHGVTGFVVNSEDEALAAIGHIRSLDRRRIRRVFEERFTATIMASRYVAIYERLLASAKLTTQSGALDHA
jgi:glycosyltransferase involved in cell wall biosynthesis